MPLTFESGGGGHGGRGEGGVVPPTHLSEQSCVVRSQMVFNNVFTTLFIFSGADAYVFLMRRGVH